MSLGVDPVSPDAMRPPATGPRTHPDPAPALRILLASAVMAAGTLAVLVYAPGPEPQLGCPPSPARWPSSPSCSSRRSTCSTSATTCAACSAAKPLRTTSAFVATAAVIVLLVLIVEMDILHHFFTTTDLTSGQWLACAASAPPSSGRANSSRSSCARGPAAADETTPPPPERTTLRPSRSYPRPASTVRTLRCIHTGFAAYRVEFGQGASTWRGPLQQQHRADIDLLAGLVAPAPGALHLAHHDGPRRRVGQPLQQHGPELGAREDPLEHQQGDRVRADQSVRLGLGPVDDPTHPAGVEEHVGLVVVAVRPRPGRPRARTGPRPAAPGARRGRSGAGSEELVRARATPARAPTGRARRRRPPRPTGYGPAGRRSSRAPWGSPGTDPPRAGAGSRRRAAVTRARMPGPRPRRPPACVRHQPGPRPQARVVASCRAARTRTCRSSCSRPCRLAVALSSAGLPQPARTAKTFVSPRPSNGSPNRQSATYGPPNRASAAGAIRRAWARDRHPASGPNVGLGTLRSIREG